MATYDSNLDPASELFHFFISYRVAYQADFSTKLHDRLNHKSSITPIPLVEFAKWPCSRFAYRRHSTSVRSGAHVFLDQRCLSDGDPWRDGFVEALRISIVFVPLLSCSKVSLNLRVKLVQSIQSEIATLDSILSRMGVINTPEFISAKEDMAAAQMRLLHAQSLPDDTDTQFEYKGSVGDFVSQNPNSHILGVQKVDNFLLELILAKELHHISCMGKRGTLRACSVILPIIIGTFPADLTDTECIATNQEAAKIIQDLGLQASTDILTYSARKIFAFFFEYQGKVLEHYGQEDHALDFICESLIQRCTKQYSSSIGSSMLAVENPLSFELQDWLKANHAFHILHTLALNDIHSVRKLSYLKDPKAVWKLASEIAALTGKTVLHESAFVSELFERARYSKLSLPLSQRMASFVDDDASSLSIMYSSSAFDIGLGKPSWRFVLCFAGLGLIASGLLQHMSLFNWQETWFNLTAGGSIFFTAIISQFLSPFVGRKFCAFSFLLMAISVAIGWLVDKFRSGVFDFANCFRCSAVYDSGPYPSYACRTADTATAITYVAAVLLLFYMMSKKQSMVWRAWVGLTSLTSVFYFIEIGYCTPQPAPSSLYTPPSVNFSVCFILWVGTEYFHHRAQILARSLSMKDERRRNSKWQTLLADEIESTAHSTFCHDVKFDCQATVAPNLSPLRQESSSIDELYFLAHISNALFQDCFSYIVTKSDLIPESLTLCGDFFMSRLNFVKKQLSQLNGTQVTLSRGPVKRPDRAISKIFRAYAGDVSRLTDLVRCSIFFDSFADMRIFVKAFFGICNFHDSTENSDNSLFFIERIRNRFDSTDEFSGAYRDFAIKVTIGIQVSSEGRYIFVPFREWYEETLSDGSLRRNKNVHLFICEIQLHHRGIQLDDEMGAAHDNYVAMRNLVSS